MLIYLYAYKGTNIYYAESLETIGDNLKEIKPDIFTAVPRLLEKVYGKIMAKGDDLTGIKRSLFFWAVKLAEKFEYYGENGAWYEFKLKIARKLIFSKWKEALGGNVKLAASGSAALSPRLARIYNAAGIPIMEGYGLTETSPVISVNETANRGFKFGTTGRPIRHVEVRIAEDGEILVKGPNLMMGYYNKPEQTAEVIDKDGWFHTGDIGELVNGEFLKITDRKKEIFKTSGGKYIAPQIMENVFKQNKFIEQIIVLGENKKHPSALIVPSFENLIDECEEMGVDTSDMSKALSDPQVLALYEKQMEKCNAGFARWEKIKKFILLDKEFTIEGGELTPTLKLKRKVIHSKYADVIESLYPEL
jgi:long-chain acyl-CoA synthetase